MNPASASRQQRVAGLSEEKRAYLARLLRQKGGGTPLPALPILPRRRSGEPLPVSWAQQRLWLLDQLEPGSPVYTTLTPLRLDASLDAAALARSLREIVRRHEVLRTTFVVIDGQPHQVIAPRLDLPLPVVDLTSLSAAAALAEASRLASREARRAFDLARGPLLRATLLRLGGGCVLLLALHHIATDGWSTLVLLRELRALYPALAAGRPSPLPEPALQYADFALWQREQLQGEALAPQMTYWKRQLAGLPRLDLPADRSRPPVPSSRGRHEPVDLDGGLRDALKALGQREGATLFMVLLAAFQVLLGRYAGQDDVPVGSPTAGRTRTELEGLIGFFVNTLVLRADLSRDPGFREALARVRETALAAYAHQEVPFEKLVEELQPARDLSRNPLFQVMFQLQDVSHPGARPAGGIALPSLEFERGTSLFDLSFDLLEHPSGLAGRLEYSTDLFERSTVLRLRGHFETMLRGIAAVPAARLSELPLLGEDEREQILAWSGSPAGMPEACVHELVEARAARSPEAPAVIWAAGTLTYRQLDRRANAVAQRLRALGAGPEARVGLRLERSPELLIAMLGVLKAGAAYLPLDPGHPPERLASLLQDAGAVAVLDRDLGTEESADRPAGGAGARSLAYVLYTSGSTGRPKGVLVSHGSLVNHGLAVAERYALRLGDRVLQLASPGFDVAAEEIFPTWMAGAAAVLPPDPHVPSTADLGGLIAGTGITVANLPASYWHDWVDHLERTDEPVPPSLRLLIAGSEPVSPRHAALWQRRAGGSCPLLVAYGVTEGTITSALHPAPPAPETLPVGRPIAGVLARVLDRHGGLSPVGVPGELHLGGNGVARGYLGRPELTAGRFLPDPYGEPGARLFRTGDRARWRPDGEIELLGRLDDQVKVRGVRVEPAEVETALGQHPDVRACAVAVREAAPGDPRLVAWLVPRETPGPSASELARFLRDRLPEPMVPAAFVALADLPRLPSGKVDRRALPSPGAGRPDLGTSYVPARGTLERRIAAVWREVLGVDRVGVHDNFFDLGGRSLLLVRVHGRLRELVDREIPMVDLFRHPTVAALAAHLGGGARRQRRAR